MTRIADYASPLYYRHSGQFSAAGLFVALLASLIAAIILGAVYAYVVLYSPLIYLSFFATVAFGFAVGWVAGYLLRWAHVRNERLTIAIAVVVALLALHSSWVFWIYALVQKATSSIAPFNPAELAFRPDRLWFLIRRINEVGVWSIGHVGGSMQKGDAVHGPWLWSVWMIEATIILFLSISISVKMGTTLPYCETCRRWCGLGKRLFSTPPGEPAILKERLESKDFTYLISLGPDKKPLPSNWFEVFLHSCDRCQALHALTVNAVRLETNKKAGNRGESGRSSTSCC